jgi:hypothetical protein
LEQVGEKTRRLILDKYPDEGVRPEVLSPDQREGDIANLPLFPNVALSAANWQAAFRQLAKRIQEMEQQPSARKSQTGDTAKLAPASVGTPPGTIQRLVQIAGASWQVISALVGIITVVVAGLTYFATREQLTQLDCRMSSNLILTTYPSQVAQLTTQIQLAQKELLDLKEGSYDRLRKQTEINDFEANKRKVSEEYEEARRQSLRYVCFEKSPNKPADKKP